MTPEVKCYIMKQRLKSAPIKKMARDLSITPQGIYRFLASLPFETGDEFVEKPELDDAVIDQIFHLYFRAKAMSLSDIAQTANVSQEEIKQLFRFCLQKKREAKEYPKFPKVTEWLNKNGYTVDRLASEIGESAHKMSTVLLGRYNMSYELGCKICSFTGLTMSELYYELLTDEQKEAMA